MCTPHRLKSASEGLPLMWKIIFGRHIFRLKSMEKTNHCCALQKSTPKFAPRTKALRNYDRLPRSQIPKPCFCPCRQKKKTTNDSVKSVSPRRTIPISIAKCPTNSTSPAFSVRSKVPATNSTSSKSSHPSTSVSLSLLSLLLGHCSQISKQPQKLSKY